MAAYQRDPFGAGGAAEWVAFVLYDYRYSFRNTVLQNGKAGTDAFWRNSNVDVLEAQIGP